MYSFSKAQTNSAISELSTANQTNSASSELSTANQTNSASSELSTFSWSREPAVFFISGAAGAKRLGRENYNTAAWLVILPSSVG